MPLSSRFQFFASRGVTLVLLCALIACPTADDPTAPAAVRILLSAEPTLIAVGGAQSTITATVVLGDGSTLPDGTELVFETDLGEVPERAVLQRGVATIRLTSGMAEGVARVIARGTNSTTLGGFGSAVTAVIDVTFGLVEPTLRATASPAQLPAGGGTSRIRAKVTGTDGEPEPNRPVEFTSTAGTFASSGTDTATLPTGADGIAVARLTTTANATVTVASLALEDELEIVVAENLPPVAAFTSSPSSPGIGRTVKFNAATSSDSDGRIVDYRWDFGDGATATGRTAEHSYSEVNTFAVVLEVTDNLGASAAAAGAVTVVAGDEPVARFIFDPAAPTFGSTIRFDASSSTSSAAIDTYTWDWGDGTSPTVTSSPVAFHTYEDPGDTAEANFVISLTITDRLGRSNITLGQLSIGVAGPTASFTVQTASPKFGSPVSFDASSSSGGVAITSYAWDWGDGSDPTVVGIATATHTYANPGVDTTYVVTLTITDSIGRTSTTARQVAVTSGDD